MKLVVAVKLVKRIITAEVDEDTFGCTPVEEIQFDETDSFMATAHRAAGVGLRERRGAMSVSVFWGVEVTGALEYRHHHHMICCRRRGT